MSTVPAPLTNWAGNVTFDAARVYRPTSVDELASLVAASRRIRAMGSGHSFSRVAVAAGDLVLLDRLPRQVDIDPQGATATVSAGMRYAEVATALHQASFGLANLASLPHITVAGSCATGTHGSGSEVPSLAASVVGLRMVGPDGEVRAVRRDTDPETFPGAVVALGALGVVTALTLAIEPAYQVSQTVRLDVPLDEVQARWDDVFDAAYSVSVFTDYASGTASVWLKSRDNRPSSGWSGGRAATVPVHPVPGMPTEWCTGQLGVPGPWYERLPHFRPDYVPGAGQELQSELFVPREVAADALAAIRGIAARVAPLIHIAELRTVRRDDLWLSTAHDRDAAAFHFTWIDDAGAVRPVLAEVEERLAPLGARPHWGKLTTLPPGRVVAGYPRAADFARLAREWDPGGKFRNPYLDTLFPRAPRQR
jgi:xylitol oxidase